MASGLLLFSAWLAFARGATVDGTAEALKELKAAYKAKDSETAVRLFDQLNQGFAALAPKEQEEVVKTIEAAFMTRRDEGDDVEKLFVGAGAALGNMGAAGEKAIVRSLPIKHLRSKPAVFAVLVEGLGQQANPAMVEHILPWLKPEKALGAHTPIVVGAANALARYREADPKLRKRVVGELVAVYADLDARYQAEHAKPEPVAEIEVAFQQVEKPLIDSLRALSGEQWENPADWNKWWATAKNADWTAPDGAASPDKKN
jgi:hypothetical protein